MSETRRSVLVTGCSDGGLGAALAVKFHEAGLKVYATARSLSKMTDLQARGIETLELDVQSQSSIQACVNKISSLDILVNNAGAMFTMPVTDISIPEAKELFDLNVWSHVAVTQAFIPLILKSTKSPIIANQTSVMAVTTVPFQSVYNASKAASAMISDTLRLELEPFGVKVVDLRTGLIKSNILVNRRKSGKSVLPDNSVYQPVKDVVEKVLRQEVFDGKGTEAHQWAADVVQNLLKNPPPVIWSGESALVTRIATMLPFGTLDGYVRKVTKLDIVAKIISQIPKMT